MTGKKGKIIQGKRARYTVYLGEKVRIFKMNDKRIRLSMDDLIASISENGSVTSGRRLYKILDTLYKSEHQTKK